MTLVTRQSSVVQQVKENDGDSWPREDQSHDQQPGHRWAEGQNDIVQKCPLFGLSWRDRPPAVRLTAHWWRELRAEKQKLGGRSYRRDLEEKEA